MSSRKVRAYIALGSNLGDRQSALAAGRAGLSALVGTRMIGSTEAEETAPLGGLDQPLYLNQMVLVETELAPDQLLSACHQIEDAAGRTRWEPWSSRTLDLDLVQYGDLLCDTPSLVLPHPGLRDRSFWAREIAQLESHD